MPSFRRSASRPPAGKDQAQADRTEAKSIHVPVARAMVDCGVYADGKRLPGKYTHAAALNKVHELEAEGRAAFVWIGLHEPDEHQMQAVADVFGLHELAVEDAVHAHQRPKLERYDNTLFLVLKTVKYVEHESVAKAREIVETGEIMIFVGRRLRGDGPARRARRAGQGAQATSTPHPRSCKLGPYAVMHAIADHVVDDYLDVTDLDRDRYRRDGGERLLPHQRTPTSSTSTCSSGRSSSCAGRSAR